MTPNIPDILVNGNVGQNHYKPICQHFNNVYRFATLYDMTNKIPLFSAYKFTGSATGRPKIPWMIEPQLNGKNEAKSMSKSPDVLYTHQAGDQDYKGSIDKKDVNRGHLFPCCHAADDDTKKSTFTLTNIVPQAVTFNNGSWNEMEANIRVFLQKQCVDNNNYIKAYVETGAVPSKNPENTLNNRVNIPSFMWTAFCCKNNKGTWISTGHWGENQKNEPTLKGRTLGELEKILSENYGDGVKVFPNNCPRENIEQVQKSRAGTKRKLEEAYKTGGEECSEGDHCDCECPA